MKNQKNSHFDSILLKNRRPLHRAAVVLTLLLFAVLLVNIQPQHALAVAIGAYDQCANDKGVGYASGDTGCRWINGNLNSNNSAYQEGDATVQRLWLNDFVPDSTHTITLSYGTTKGGKHAYDFLTTWNLSESWITLDDRCQDITGCTTAAEDVFSISDDPNVPAAYFVPASRQFVMRGGDLTAATTPTIFSGTYTSDSETRITISFTVGPSNGSLCETKGQTTTCGVVLWFGGHVARQLDWGAGTSAGSISGSPYHVAFVEMDGASVGQRDNQMQLGAPTVAELDAIEADWNETTAQIDLSWTSATEHNVVGYNVQRKRGPGRWKQINPALIAAKNPGMLFGAVYNFNDAAVKHGKKYKYRIEIVYASGAARVSDVVKVKVPKE
ncbi:MAG: hypothetical protein IT331_16590 [Anaerolineae bacterium]|nr:hypothetical protein [Anaerolineae bacterium]